MQKTVTIMEVSPRDGLQNESARLSTEDKLTLIHRALDAGCKRVEVTSFAHPKVVPQMADAEAVCQGLPQRGDVIYTGPPAGVGAGFDPPKWLKAGDTVRVEIGHLGHIENKIVDEPETMRIG